MMKKVLTFQTDLGQPDLVKYHQRNCKKAFTILWMSLDVILIVSKSIVLVLHSLKCVVNLYNVQCLSVTISLI